MKYNNNNSNEKEYNKKKEGGGIKKKTKKTKQTKKQPVMHNAIAHHPLTDAQLVPEPRSAPSWPTAPSLYTGNLGIEPATFLRY